VVDGEKPGVNNNKQLISRDDYLITKFNYCVMCTCKMQLLCIRCSSSLCNVMSIVSDLSNGLLCCHCAGRQASP